MTSPGSDDTVGATPAPPASADAPIRRAPDALVRTGDFGVVVLGTRQVDPVTLAGTGVVLWEVLAQPRRRAELFDVLATRFGTDRARIAGDVDPVLDDLLAGGVLEVVA